ncbi:DNA-processing protein DprA [Cognatishimia activa]|uniref:DNA-protecting protein DprA n=1 Tax=Cognatishimia activa TaxID=1715691 RepID=A0A975I7A3_9RHOB|nr:DNA-processing protein DprA [Cognatishimia activa]QTN35953.1 DNA-protecting protein DprA [Cognatishimia activa]
MTDGQFSSTHPKNPPTTEDERFLWLRLLRSRRVGPATFHRLMGEYGSAQAALSVLPEIAAEAGVDDYSICPEGVIEAELKAARKAKAQLICFGDPDYPKPLYDLGDAPPLLWARGDIGLLHREAIALVGARNASSLGCRMACSLSLELGQKAQVIVSGLARGIDAAAHEAALKTGTIAVFGGGVDRIYPAENKTLAEDILKQGLILSEQPMGLQPQARHFPARNRIISGLTRAVVVVEAAAKSGSLITARNALDQGRDVLAVPGHPFDARAAGCNILIRDGATLVRNAEDIIEELAIPEPVQPDLPLADEGQDSLSDSAKLHDKILNRLGPIPLAEDQLIFDLKSKAKSLAPALSTLELHGKILRRAGGLLSRR